MATITKQSCLAEIGETAGQVWHLLSDKSPLTIAKLVKEVDAPRDTVMQSFLRAGCRARRQDRD